MDTYQKVLALQSIVTEQVNKGKFRLAIDSQLESLKLAQGLDRPKLMAILYVQLGKILEQKGEIQKTVYAYEAGFKALNREDHRLLDTTRRLRSVRKSFQKPSKIEVPDVFSPTIATSIETALEAKDLNIQLLIHIGNSYFAQPQLGPALNAYQQVLLQTNIDSFPVLKGQALVKIAEIYRQLKKSAAAKEKVEEGLKLLAKYGQETDQRFAFSLKARLLFQANKIKQALPVYEKALELFEITKDDNNAAKVLAQMGQLYLGIPNFQKAKKYYEKALTYAQQTRLNHLYWHLYWGLGCCYWEAKDWEKAAIYFEKSRTKILARQNRLYTDEGKVTFLDSVQDVFNRLIESYLNIGTDDAIKKAFEVAETAKGQSLTDMMQGRNRRRARPSSNSANNPNSATNFNSPIQQMSSGVPTIAPTLDEDIDPNFNQIMGALDSDNPQVSIQQSVPSMGVPNALPDFDLSDLVMQSTDETLPLRKVGARYFLSFFSLESSLLVWLKLPNGKLHFHKWAITRKELKAKVQGFRLGLMDNAKSRGITITRSIKVLKEEDQRGTVSRQTFEQDTDFSTLKQEFYQHFFQPFQTVFSNEQPTLVIVPHNVLWQIPFAALVDENGKTTGSQYQIIYTPSIKILNQIDKESPYSELSQAKALIVGNPTMSKADKRYSFSPLKGAEKEAKALGKLFDTTPFLQQTATQAVVEKGVSAANILHLATHGMSESDNPLDSYIVLADQFKPDGSIEKDGLLKAREIMTWSVPCELVNLSACQTALGKISGEGIIGLSRAFLVAGSRSVLVSLWNISDEATAEFMIQFYTYYLEVQNKALALQKTMQDFQKHTAYHHPVYWSGFTLVGSDD